MKVFWEKAVKQGIKIPKEEIEVIKQRLKFLNPKQEEVIPMASKSVEKLELMEMIFLLNVLLAS